MRNRHPILSDRFATRLASYSQESNALTPSVHSFPGAPWTQESLCNSPFISSFTCTRRCSLQNVHHMIHIAPVRDQILGTESNSAIIAGADYFAEFRRFFSSSKCSPMRNDVKCSSDLSGIFLRCESQKLTWTGRYVFKSDADSVGKSCHHYGQMFQLSCPIIEKYFVQQNLQNSKSVPSLSSRPLHMMAHTCAFSSSSKTFTIT